MTQTNLRPSADLAGARVARDGVVMDAVASDDVAMNDQSPVAVGYGHGRMPMFMKVAWLGFLAFIAWYVTVNLLPALGTELGG